MKTSKHDIMKTVTIIDFGTVTMSQGALNSLSMTLFDAADKNRSEKCDAYAKLRLTQALQIHDILKESGFYEK